MAQKQGCARDLPGRDRDETRDVDLRDPRRDRDVRKLGRDETETETLGPEIKTETETLACPETSKRDVCCRD